MNTTIKEETSNRLDSPLQRVLDDMMKMNEYDYSKMLAELELLENKDQNKKKKIKQLKEEAKAWREKISNMKQTKDRIILDRRSETLEQIRRKNESSSKILDKSKLDREQRLIKMNKTMQTDNSIKKKMEEHFKKMEEDRVEIEKLIENRLSLYSQNNQEHLENLKNKFSQRISDSLDVFQRNLQLVKEKMDQKAKDDEQKTIDKFEKWFVYLKKRKEDIKKEMEKRQNKRSRNNENFNELEVENDRKRSEFKKKLDSFEQRKREISEKQKEKIMDIINKEKISLQKIKENKKKSEEDKQTYYDNILRYQTSVITRGDLKESSSELSRLSAYEKVILRQMQIERKLNLFHSEMNRLKDSSVMKKSKQQKRGIFLELKREEEERRKKEQEDKEKAMNK